MNEIRKKLIQTINRFEEVKVLVAGDVMLDIYEFCHSENSKPIDSEKPGKFAYRSHEIIKVPGGAGNVAANLAALDIPVSLIGLTGNDEHYYKLHELADQLGINHFFYRDPSRPTTVKARLYVDNEYLLRRDDEAVHKVDEAVSNILMKEFQRELPKSNIVILSDYNKGFFTAKNGQQIISDCRKRHIPVIVDFKPDNHLFFKNADLMVPNAAEAARLLPSFSLQDLRQSIRKLHDKLSCEKLVITLGAGGICGLDGYEFFRIAGNSVSAVDAVGCGDTVRALLAVGISLNLSLAEAAILANDAAAVIVQKPATASISRQELIDFINSRLPQI